MTIEEARARCTELSLSSLEVGGIALLDRVDAAMGAARRHLKRVEDGALSWVPGVEREVRGSLDAAAALVDASRQGRG